MFQRFLILFVSLMLVATAHSAESPRVVVSIAPIHSLVAGVMDGVAEPELLVSGNSSPHNFMLKPSQVRSLHGADVVVWVGENVESFLPKSLASLGDEKTIIKLMDAPEMLLLSAREGGVWDTSRNQHHDHDHNEIDGHLWLDPGNAGIIVKTMVTHLSQLDPDQAETYRSNGKRLLQQLTNLDHELKQGLTPIRQTPYLVFHDAYQYLEQRYQLSPVGAIMVDPERKPGARRLQEIRERINTQQVRCVFSEPQYSDKLLQVVIEDTSLKIATLDPMGHNLAPGQSLYFDLMRSLGHELVSCLRNL